MKSKSKDKNYNPKQIINSYTKAKSNIINVCLYLLVLVLPLIYFNGYFNILEAKFFTYCAIMLCMFFLLFVFYIKNSFKWKKFWVQETKLWLKEFFKDKNNIFSLCFLTVAIISTLFSSYPQYAFWGTAGRYSGLFLIAIYVVSYIVISTNLVNTHTLIKLFLASSVIVMALGITDYFRLDILQLRVNVHPLDKDIFVSTLGNINTFAAFISLVTGLCATLFVFEQKNKNSFIYFAIVTLGFFNAIISRSDSVYIAFAILFVTLPFFALKNKLFMVRFFALVVSFLLCLKIVLFLNLTIPQQVILIDESIISILKSPLIWFFVIILCILAFLTHKFYNEKYIKYVLISYIIFVVLILITLVYALIDVNIFQNYDRYGVFLNYLLFNNEWGSFRGVIWLSSLDIFSDFSFINKLIGSGPDTFILLISNSLAQQTFLQNGVALDNAHNEYLHYLLTLGLLGVTFYIAFLTSSLVYIYKAAVKNIYVLSCFVAVICYAAQAIVNLNLPIVTPLMWLFLSIAVSNARHSKN